MQYENIYSSYITKKQSVAQIAKKEGCSQNKINYWLKKFKINKRTISDAVYQFHNPQGDPFVFKYPRNLNDAIIYGLGLGLYWGEGSKGGQGGVRLGNTDAKLIKMFVKFLEKAFNVKKDKLRFGLQIFNDISQSKALNYWCKEIGIRKDQFYKVIVSKVRGEGTYKYKSEYGVIMIYFNNTRLKFKICDLIENLK